MEPLFLQLGIDYYLPHLTFKGLVGLTASPTVTASASTGWNDLTLGGQAVFDTAKDDSLTAWTAGVGKPLPACFSFLLSLTAFRGGRHSKGTPYKEKFPAPLMDA